MAILAHGFLSIKRSWGDNPYSFGVRPPQSDHHGVQLQVVEREHCEYLRPLWHLGDSLGSSNIAGKPQESAQIRSCSMVRVIDHRSGCSSLHADTLAEQQ